jgi:hypothetical protein
MNRAQTSGEPRGDGARRSARRHGQGDNPSLKPVSDTTEDHPEFEAWVAYERSVIEAALDARIALWARLGLKLPPRGDEVFRLARINNAVDLAGRL